jgi:hypothetical protein
MFNKIWKTFEEQYELDIYLRLKPRGPKIIFAIKYIIISIKRLYCDILCKFKGHKWQDEGNVTPESGYIEMCCKRCGYSHPKEYLF